MDHFTRKNQAPDPKNAQSGSIFVWIFVMIALFAALSYALSQGLRTGSSTLTQQQAKVAAQEILQYGTKMNDTVKKLLILNGCNQGNLNFLESTYALVANPSAPASGECDVFDPDAGAMEIPGKFTNGMNVYTYRVVGVNQFNGVGCDRPAMPYTNCTDLALLIIDVPLEVCKSINELLNIRQSGYVTPEEPDITLGAGFQGSYTSNNDPVGNAASSSALVGERTACFKESTTQTYTSSVSSSLTPYIFYQILLAR